jgi:hypothetical protein
MATMIEAGTRVKKGYYFSGRGWQLHPVQRDGEILPGERAEKWLRVPFVGAVVIAPLMGAAFLMFLPFVGVYLTVLALTRPAVLLFQRSASGVAATMAPTLVPGEAHLAGERAEKKASDANAPADDGHLEALKKEIEEKRS